MKGNQFDRTININNIKTKLSLLHLIINKLIRKKKNYASWIQQYVSRYHYYMLILWLTLWATFCRELFYHHYCMRNIRSFTFSCSIGIKGWLLFYLDIPVGHHNEGNGIILDLINQKTFNKNDTSFTLLKQIMFSRIHIIVFSTSYFFFCNTNIFIYYIAQLH